MDTVGFGRPRTGVLFENRGGRSKRQIGERGTDDLERGDRLKRPACVRLQRGASSANFEGGEPGICDHTVRSTRWKRRRAWRSASSAGRDPTLGGAPMATDRA